MMQKVKQISLKRPDQGLRFLLLPDLNIMRKLRFQFRQGMKKSPKFLRLTLQLLADSQKYRPKLSEKIRNAAKLLCQGREAGLLRDLCRL